MNFCTKSPTQNQKLLSQVPTWRLMGNSNDFSLGFLHYL